MAIPTKRHERNDLAYLTKPEIEALLQAPDRTTWLGRRDHTLLLTMITTGVRVSELIAIKTNNVTLATGAHHEISRPFDLSRFASGRLIDEAAGSGIEH